MKAIVWCTPEVQVDISASEQVRKLDDMLQPELKAEMETMLEQCAETARFHILNFLSSVLKIPCVLKYDMYPEPCVRSSYSLPPPILRVVGPYSGWTEGTSWQFYHGPTGIHVPSVYMKH